MQTYSDDKFLGALLYYGILFALTMSIYTDN